MYVKRVWEFLLRPNEILQELKNKALPKSKQKELLDELSEHANKFGIEFEGATDILRTGDSGGHFHNRINAIFESSAFKRFGIRWETHTLCKRHAYSLCDAHGGAVKRCARQSAVIGELPREAADFARAIMTHAKFGNTRAIAYTHMDMSTKEKEYAALANMDGMKKACEFQYHYIDDGGDKVYMPGFVRFRTVSGDESAPWNAVYLPRVEEGGESQKVCAKCTQGRQRPVWHDKSAGRCKKKWAQVGDNRVLLPALREAGGENMMVRAMHVVDMCEWARLNGMVHLVDAIRNTVLDGVRVIASMSSPELSEDLFTQMGLDASKKAAFQEKLADLRTHGWIRPLTKQVKPWTKNTPRAPRKPKQDKETGPPSTETANAPKKKTRPSRERKKETKKEDVDVPEAPQAAERRDGLERRCLTQKHPHRTKINP